MPFFLLGPIAHFVLTYPRLAAFLKRFWKLGLLIALVFGAWLSAHIYLQHRDTANYNRGFSVAEQQYKAKVTKANAIAAADQKALDLMTQRFGQLSQTREQDIHVSLQPQIERITREIENNPVYRQCLVTDGVFDGTNAAVATVNARLGASAPRAAR